MMLKSMSGRPQQLRVISTLLKIIKSNLTRLETMRHSKAMFHLLMELRIRSKQGLTTILNQILFMTLLNLLLKLNSLLNNLDKRSSKEMTTSLASLDQAIKTLTFLVIRGIERLHKKRVHLNKSKQELTTLLRLTVFLQTVPLKILVLMPQLKEEHTDKNLLGKAQSSLALKLSNQIERSLVPQIMEQKDCLEIRMSLTPIRESRIFQLLLAKEKQLGNPNSMSRLPTKENYRNCMVAHIRQFDAVTQFPNF